MEETFDRAWEAGCDAKFSTLREGLQTWVTMRGHFTEIGDGFKTDARITQALKHFILNASRDDLSIGTAAVEKCGRGVRHKRRDDGGDANVRKSQTMISNAEVYRT